MVISDTSGNANVERNWYPNGVLEDRDKIYGLYATDQNGNDNPRHLVLAKKAWDMAEWPTEREIIAESPSRDYLRAGITVDQNGILYVVYRQDVAADTLYDLDELAYVASNDAGNTWTSPVIVIRPGHDAGYLTVAVRVIGAGIDIAWRESSSDNVNDQDITAILHVQLDLLGVVDRSPEVRGIPDQPIAVGEAFTPFDLDNYLIEFDGDAVSWSYSGNSELTVFIDGDNVATITTPSDDWSGSENVTFTATDQTAGSLADSDDATFTVGAVGVIDWNKIPGSYRLFNNYPNPFNPTSNVEFHLKAAGKVQLIIYNILGEEVATLVNKEMPAGVHQVIMNASNLPSGIYFYKLLVNDFTATKKMVLLK